MELTKHLFCLTIKRIEMNRKPFSVIKTPRLIVRPYALKDAPELCQSMKDGTNHLLPWLPWAKDEPQSLLEKQQLIATFIKKFNNLEDFVYDIFDHSNTRLLGGTGLHPRVGPNNIEIGYWVRYGETGNGIATEASYAMSRAALLLDYTQVIIRMDAKNRASIKVPQKLGFTEVINSEHRIINGVEGRVFITTKSEFIINKKNEPLEFID